MLGSREEETVPHLSRHGDGFSPRPYRAMTSADLNQDGHGDLVVGAPGYSHPGHVHVGRVYLIYGNDLGLPPIDLDLEEEAHGVLEGFQVRRLAGSGFLSVTTARLSGQVPGTKEVTRTVGAPVHLGFEHWKCTQCRRGLACVISCEVKFRGSRHHAGQQPWDTLSLAVVGLVWVLC